MKDEQSTARRTAHWVEAFRKALMDEHSNDWTMETIAEAAHICARIAAGPHPCPVSGTVPHTEGFEGGYYYDGGFHHCACGTIAPWSARPSEGGVVEAHDQPAWDPFTVFTSESEAAS
jgi:hypothetical protein